LYLGVWTCIWVSGLVFGCLNFYFGCLDLYLGVWTCFPFPGWRDFRCLNLYFGRHFTPAKRGAARRLAKLEQLETGKAPCSPEWIPFTERLAAIWQILRFPWCFLKKSTFCHINRHPKQYILVDTIFNYSFHFGLPGKCLFLSPEKTHFWRRLLKILNLTKITQI